MKYLLSIILLLTILPILSYAQPRVDPQEKTKTPEELKAEADAALWIAIEKGDPASFYSLLESGADVNAHNENGTTLLMIAAIHERTELLKVLISRGADVNARNESGGTALMYAVGNVEIVRELLTAGADVRAKNEIGWTALKFALKSAYVKEESYQKTIELLRAYGARKQ